MSEWTKKKIKDLCILHNGRAYSQPELLDIGKYPVLRVGNFFSNNSWYYSDLELETQKYCKKGDLLFAWSASFGPRIWKGEKVIYHYHIWKIEIDENLIDKIFLYYWLLNSTKKFTSNTHGSIMLHITKSNMEELNIVYPHNIIYQQKIASTLSSIDDKIELNNKINEELKAMAKTIYDYWFVQFEFPNAEGKPYKSSGGKMVYNEQLKREIPEGWNVKTLGGWIKNEKTGDWGKEQKEGNYTVKVSCIRGADINGINGKGDVSCPQRYILEKNSFKILEGNEIVVEISGGSPTQSTGRMTYITKEVQDRFSNPLICSNFCKVISLKNKDHIYVFTQLWQMLYDNDVFFGFEGKTSGIKNLLFDALTNSYNTVVPNDETIKSFNKIYKPIYTKIQKNLKENEELASLRDWLLPMLMNGQVGFKEEGIEKKHENILSEKQDQRFEMWLSQQGAAARGDIDLSTLREIFDNMDEDDK